MGGFSTECALPDLAGVECWQQNRGCDLDKWIQGKDIKQVGSLQTFSVFNIHMEDGIGIQLLYPGQFDNFY